jgi:BirA family biotin operon repressor/biotin-[acetyl-CoA-carboxylase] ligase
VNLKWIHLEAVSSTNSYLQGLIRKGTEQAEIVVIADYQEIGRGQGEKTWISDKGENLLMSVLLYPEFLSASRQFQLSIMASLAVSDILLELELHPSIKWPNDILEGGAKIAGILIENGILGQGISHSIIGIGINVNQVRFPEFPVRATSLVNEKGERYDTILLARMLEDKLLSRYQQLIARKENDLKGEYLNRLYALDEPIRCTSSGREFTGIIRGISDFGELLVEKEGEIGTYGMHTIGFIL